MSLTIPERYVWAIGILDVQPADVILEIGCGYGHSVPLICDKLANGQLIAIDRSEEMVAAATKANRGFVTSGKVQILHCDLLDSDLPSSHCDKIFLYNLNVFWMDPRDELAEVRRLLKPSGRFYIFHQPPPRHDLDEYDKAFDENLSKGGFEILEVRKNAAGDVRSVGLLSRPIRQ